MKINDEIPGLTPIRGIAALRVMTMHFTMYLFPAVGIAMADAMPVFSRAYLGVDYFFVLSGFILAHVYGRRFTESVSSSALRRFWWARFSRIYPLHLITLLILACWQYGTKFAYLQMHGTPIPREAFTVNMTLESLVTNLLMVQIFFDGQDTSWNYPAWSLSAEWGSYLLLPFLFRIYFKLPGWSIPLGMVAAVIGLFGVERVFFGHLDVAGWPGFFRCLLDQFLGVLFYRLYRQGFASRILERDGATLLLGIAIIGLMSLRALPDAVIVPSVAAMVWAIAANRGKVGDWLNSKPMRRLGDLSYGIYIWHGVIHLVLYRTGTLFYRGEYWREVSAISAIGAMTASYLLVLLMARLSLRYVETPARRWLREELPRKLSARTKAVPSAAVQ